ncbi:calcium-binding protein [Acuticoccus sediminis]|uniref:calcium-binding protein n=1 Tax=Acuticoccus sediminis TaxID=2184697 RepID=UPI001CFECE0E|nr:calcium-binding protein [Acuticoccus sediminis]
MARATTFSTEYFNASGGYSITEVNDTVDRYAFRHFLRELRTDHQVDLGLPQPVDGSQLHAIFSQLRVPPIVDGVKHIDVSGVLPTIEYIMSNGGFRDTWVIGNDRGGGLRGTTTDDMVLGGDGNDVILGRSGDDYVNAGAGDDRVGGGMGDDQLYGGDGNDVIHGRRGDDILQGGIGNDTLMGAQGADTFLFEADDFGRGPSVDVIRDYRPAQGDQIVDTTGQLVVEHFGQIPGYGRATVLVNEQTDDRVVVYGARVHDDDILTQYQEPNPATQPAHSQPREGIYVGGTPSAPTGVVNLRLQRIGSYQDGDNYVETFQVLVRNNTDKTILNASDLDIKLTGGALLNVVPDSVFGGTYYGGEFDLSSGGNRALAATQELSVLQFSISNRSPITEVAIDGASTNGFIPDYPGAEQTYYQPAFQIDVRLSGQTTTGGNAEVYITNIGNQTLVDLDNMEFRFKDADIKVVDDPWGADYYNNTFAVEPWASDSPHGALDQTATVKLFGFSYEKDGDSDAKVDVNDFRLTSDFNDLIT